MSTSEKDMDVDMIEKRINKARSLIIGYNLGVSDCLSQVL